MRNLMRTTLLACVLCLCLVAPGLARPWEDGNAAYKRGDHATALRLWRPLAEQGNANAQHYLGNMYANGHGVPQDYAEAVKWHRKAAEQGHAGGQISLGKMYYNGKGVPQDYAKAVTWLRKAAEQGGTRGQALLGLMYYNGKGVQQDYVEAHKWTNLAAVQGFKGAGKVRDAMARRMTPDQIAEAQRLAREWKPKK